ncbi:MAG: thiaminase II [Candidatus Eisenbacteria bacterium]|nr:thiaminase II [Candidatus Latescibacterota bacterium]MBD3303251.1 thiaminase II [Candidatus Eisenbacteria bacterium]
MNVDSFVEQIRRETDLVWEAILAHPFVRGIGDGSIAPERFVFYLRQDYLYLIDFSRVLALGCAKGESLDEMRRFSSLLETTLTSEMDLHRRTCRDLGIVPETLEEEEPAVATIAYTNQLVRVAYEGGFGDIVAAILPCAAGYVEIAARLRAGATPEPAFCREWIQTYSSPEMKDLAGWLGTTLDARAEKAGPDRRERWFRLYEASARLELLFFDAAWRGPAVPDRSMEG